MTKLAGSESISQRHGSADPDPHQNIMDPQHCLQEKQAGFLVNAIKWNFTKFVVNKEGQPVYRSSPTDDPIPKVEEVMKKYF